MYNMLREMNSKPKCVFPNIKYNVNTTRCYWFYDLSRYGTAKSWVRIILTVLSGHRWSSFCGVPICCLYTHIIYICTLRKGNHRQNNYYITITLTEYTLFGDWNKNGRKCVHLYDNMCIINITVQITYIIS